MSVSLSPISSITCRIYGGRGILAASVQAQQLQTKRNGSEIKFIDTDISRVKRGRGGRSSFNGTVATIFGAPGFLGRVLCARLGSAGTQMIIPYRGDSYDVRDLKLTGDLGQVNFLPFELRDEESIRRAVKHSDVVINLIGKTYETRHYKLSQMHVEGAARIARISKEMGVEKFIHVSSLNCERVHEDYMVTGGSRFMKTKFQGEQAVRKEFPSATIIRPSDIFGNNDKFLEYYSKSPRKRPYGLFLAVPHCGINIWKQPICVRDVARGIANAIDHIDAPGKTYAAVGPRRYELRAIVDYMFEVTRHDNIKHIHDTKSNPYSNFYVRANEALGLTGPWQDVCVEQVEREAITDLVGDLPTLYDLDVTKYHIMENIIATVVKNTFLYENYKPMVGDWTPAIPPKYEAIYENYKY